MKMLPLKSFSEKVSIKVILTSLVLITVVLSALYYGFFINNKLSISHRVISELEAKNVALMAEIDSLKKEIDILQTEDPRAKNKEILATISQMKETYKKAVSVYEDLVDLREISKNTKKLDELYASSISILSQENYASASASLTQLTKDIETERQKTIIATAVVPANAPVNNNPPSSGYSRQTVNSDAGSFVVSIVSGDLGNTKVIVDTASDGDCGNNCPVLPLATYVSRSGAYAGINGSYFCPASYPTCAGKTNTFDLLVMNKKKTYFNSANNVYSNNPAVIFGGGYMRFVSAASQWGRDTGIDGMLSNYPLLVEGGNVRFGGDDDPKKGSKGNRSFVSNKGSTAYIGVVHNATVAEAARVLKSMGMENALNLDSGGSTALWSGGYKLGPGRDLPNVILFVRK
ncbi:phosphodiester glycosidase family protein [Candidatus Woesebacteria bacterium]|nr:phosphodiester glycosidase family protein [Candidatus Woesebacteria bacterium]MBP9687242.1 phosphodiester glycosidase family protein [Candidatus Woesebacteria bacterium]